MKRKIWPVERIFGREFLFDLILSETVGVEIGVYRGEFSRALFEHTSPETLYLIDPWVPDADTYRASLPRMDRRHANVLRRFRSERSEDRVQVLRLSSQEAAHLFEDHTLDWIYVDGDHREDAVRSDIEKYWPKLKRDGLMIFDDYGFDAGWDDGVTKACDALLPALPASRVTESAHQLVVRKERKSRRERGPRIE